MVAECELRATVVQQQSAPDAADSRTRVSHVTPLRDLLESKEPHFLSIARVYDIASGQSWN